MHFSRLLPLLILAFALTAAEKSPLVLDASNRPSVITAADVIRLPSAGPFFTGIYPTATADRDITLPDATTTLAGLGVAQTFTAAQTIQAATGITSLQAATQDAVRILGRAGGSSSHVATITPPTLAGNITVTLPAATSALATLALSEALTNKTLTSPAINTATIIGGTANNISLGATTRNTAAVTTLSATGSNSAYWGGAAYIASPPPTSGLSVHGWISVANTQTGGYDSGFTAWQSTTAGVAKPSLVLGMLGSSSWDAADVATQVSSFYILTRNGADAMVERLRIASSGATTLNGALTLAAAGNGLLIKEGTNATLGTATLVAGTVVVSTTKVTAASRIQLTGNSDGGTPGWLRVSARAAGTSFTVTSSSGADTGTVGWVIVEPAP